VGPVSSGIKAATAERIPLAFLSHFLRDFIPPFFRFYCGVLHSHASFPFPHISTSISASPFLSSCLRFYCGVPNSAFPLAFVFSFLLPSPSWASLFFLFPHISVATSRFSNLAGYVTSPRTNHRPHHLACNTDPSAALHSSLTA
jgi:hypothetical protein